MKYLIAFAMALVLVGKTPLLAADKVEPNLSPAQKEELDKKFESFDGTEQEKAFTKAMVEDIGVFKMLFFARKAGSLRDDQQELEKDTDVARKKLQALIVEKPAPSDELNLLFTRYLKASAAEVKANFDMMIGMREYLKAKTMQMVFDLAESPEAKALNEDKKARVEGLVPDGATVEQAAKILAVKKANEDHLKEAGDDFNTATKLVMAALTVEPVAADIEARIKLAQDKNKILTEKKYAQIFQMRGVYTAEQMKDYFKKNDDLKLVFEKEAEERKEKKKALAKQKKEEREKEKEVAKSQASATPSF